MALTAVYLKEAITNIAIGALELKDDSGKKVFLETLPYPAPEPTAARWLAPSATGLHWRSEDRGFPNVGEIWTVPWIMTIGAVDQEFEGVSYTRFYEYVPLFIMFLRAHPLLQFTNAMTEPSFIAPTGISVLSSIRSGIEDTEENEYLWAEILVEIPFAVSFERTKYVDDNAITIN